MSTPCSTQATGLTLARQIFADETQRRPAGIYTLRQRARVIEKWPAA